MTHILDLIAQKPVVGYSASAASPVIATIAKASSELPMWAVYIAWLAGIAACATTVYANLRRKQD